VNSFAELPVGDVLTVAQVARGWCVSKMTVYRLVKDGELPAYQIGRSYRITQEAVDLYVLNHAIPNQRDRK